MKKKTAYAVFTLTDSGKDYMVKGNFGSDEPAAALWAVNNAVKVENGKTVIAYPNGLFVKEVKY